METQAVIESVTHACTYAQMYFLFNNQECALLASILLCVCVFQRLVWKSEKHISQNLFPGDSSLHSISESFHATSFKSRESGRILSTPGTLGLGSPHTGWLQQLPQTSQAIPALGLQDLVVSLHIHTTSCFPKFTAFFFSLFLIFTIPSLRNIL